MEFGKTMRAAREAKNYTVSQLAEMTHLTPQVVDGLEMENFSRIAAPIYGRGFVKLYCEAVGLDAKAMQQAFMAAYNGETPPPAKDPVPKPQPAQTPAPEPPSETRPETEPEPATQAEPPPLRDDLFSGSRYAAPTSSYGALRKPQIPWRLLLVGAAALAILVFAVFSIRFVWRQLSAPVEGDRVTRVARDAAQAKTAAKDAAPVKTVQPAPKRTPQDVKSIYID